MGTSGFLIERSAVLETRQLMLQKQKLMRTSMTREDKVMRTILSIIERLYFLRHIYFIVPLRWLLKHC